MEFEQWVFFSVWHLRLLCFELGDYSSKCLANLLRPGRVFRLDI
jgi:hypothetical protein